MRRDFIKEHIAYASIFILSELGSHQKNFRKRSLDNFRNRTLHNHVFDLDSMANSS
jgi:hypothetical protein